jgi:hypothetical protein
LNESDLGSTLTKGRHCHLFEKLMLSCGKSGHLEVFYFKFQLYLSVCQFCRSFCLSLNFEMNAVSFIVTWKTHNWNLKSQTTNEFGKFDELPWIQFGRSNRYLSSSVKSVFTDGIVDKIKSLLLDYWDIVCRIDSSWQVICSVQSCKCAVFVYVVDFQ